jgi:Rod binding domain-containing protein
MNGISAVLPPSGGQPEITKDAVATSAEQFEALLVAQMLRSMRETEGAGWMGGGEDQAGASLMEYAEQEISRVIAANGGFGLAKMVGESLTPRSDATPSVARTYPNR